ncbi:MAG: SDR family NAD(P)-dependent oxidoreductase [Reyranellaceae bacterium]
MVFPDLADKVALVTGANGGVGFQAARKLAESGAIVMINGRTTENCEKALAKLRQASDRIDPDKCSFAVGDTSNYEDARRVAEQAGAINGGIDVLVSAGAHGAVRPMPFADMSGQELAAAFNSRYFARINPVHAALPYLRVRGGAVVMLGTDAGRHATSGESIVGAYGAAVILTTKVLAKEFARWKIRVNAVSLTLTADTPGWDRIFSEQTFQTNLFGKALDRFPFGRPPNAEEVARVVMFLASEGASQVTGQTLSANGGLSFGGW